MNVSFTVSECQNDIFFLKKGRLFDINVRTKKVKSKSGPSFLTNRSRVVKHYVVKNLHIFLSLIDVHYEVHSVSNAKYLNGCDFHHLHSLEW